MKANTIYLLAGLGLLGFVIYKYRENQKQLDKATQAGATPYGG